MARILVTGSRDWDNFDVMYGALKTTHGLFNEAYLTLVHGDCRGADRMAAAIWSSAGLPIEAHPAKWHELGKKAGLVRNAEMVELGADLCLAFLLPQSNGSVKCAALAEDKGIRVEYYYG